VLSRENQSILAHMGHEDDEPEEREEEELRDNMM
jgi:hypothetical protein